jgi:hypothetical protein
LKLWKIGNHWLYDSTAIKQNKFSGRSRCLHKDHHIGITISRLKLTKSHSTCFKRIFFFVIFFSSVSTLSVLYRFLMYPNQIKHYFVKLIHNIHTGCNRWKQETYLRKYTNWICIQAMLLYMRTFLQFNHWT